MYTYHFMLFILVHTFYLVDGTFVCHQNGSLEYGYIHFETEEAAGTSVEKVNGKKSCYLII